MFKSPAQTLLVPDMAGEGNGLTVTVNGVAAVIQPVDNEISVKLMVPVPAAPQLTKIALVPAPDAMLPPETDQK